MCDPQRQERRQRTRQISLIRAVQFTRSSEKKDDRDRFTVVAVHARTEVELVVVRVVGGVGAGGGLLVAEEGAGGEAGADDVEGEEGGDGAEGEEETACDC